MKKILFVCTGNTCRSCMAEAIFNKFCDIDHLTAYSAGISVVPGSVASSNSVEVVKKYIDMDIRGRRAVQLTNSSIKDSNLILTMTEYIKSILTGKFSHFKYKIFTLKEYISQKGDIKDPFGGNIMIYETAFRELKVDILALLKKLKGDTGIIY